MAIKNITSLTNQEIKNIYQKLNSHKHELICVESQKVFDQLKLENQIDYLICTQNWYDLNKNKYHAKNTFVVNKAIIDKLSDIKYNNYEVLFIWNYQISGFNIDKNQKYIILDNIQDPGNLANILRTSLALDCKQIFVSKNGVNPLNRKIIRSCVGALFNLKINFYDDLVELIKQLKKINYFIVGTYLDKNAIKLSTFRTKLNSFCLIMGNEGNGISNNAIELCDLKIFIDINNIDSLNVSVAYGIILYWLSNN